MQPTRLLTTRISALYLVSMGAFFNLHLLIAVVPILASRQSGAEAAGLATAAVFAATVVAQACMPVVLSRASHRLTLAVGMLLMGPTALAYASSSAWLLLVASFARGVGFGMVAVVTTTLVAAYAPAGTRGSSFGTYGLLLGCIAIVAPPLGVFLVHSQSPMTVVLVGAVAPVVFLPWVVALTEPPPGSRARDGNLTRRHYRGAANSGFIAPLATFMAATFGYGAMVSAVPLSFSSAAAPAFLVLGVALTITRTVAGRLADRFGGGVFLAPAVTSAAAGCALIWFAATSGGTAWLFLGVAVFGAGLGSLTTLSYALLTRESTGGSFVLASTLWNLAYDGGIGAGGLMLAVLAPVGVATIYAVAAVVLGLTLTTALFRPRETTAIADVTPQR